MNIYVGNLSEQTTEEDLRHAFEGFGQVASTTIIKDRISGRPRGFGFVEMPIEVEALDAISSLKGKALKGQRIVVDQARPRR